jgi:hypothetical protein
MPALTPPATPTVTNDPPDADATAGLTEDTDTDGTTENCIALVLYTEDAVLTSTDTAPRAPAGDTQRASVDDITDASTGMPAPNLHAVRPATKPAPESVTTVPPDTDPEDGDTEVTEPADTYSTCTPLWLISPPLLIDTSTTRMPAPRAGITQLAAEEEDTAADK